MVGFKFEFRYAEEKAPALRQTGGSIPKGRCVVLCGSSGCGKSTLCNLIARFWDVHGGSVSLADAACGTTAMTA